MNNRKPWTAAENADLVIVYFYMLDRAIAGKPYNKAAIIRAARTPHQSNGGVSFAGKLANRSRASIEAKLMNASAAHADLSPGAVTMAAHGYKAWGNYQAALKDAMRAALDDRDTCRIVSGAGDVETVERVS